MNKILNILIPCAGQGSRFFDVGYTLPKPLIPVLGKPMIQWVMESININNLYNYGINFRCIFLVLKKHDYQFNIIEQINKLLSTAGHTFLTVDSLTEGAACTSLIAKQIINTKESLMICNSDQYFRYDLHDFFFNSQSMDNDGTILTFQANHPKWSYAKTQENTTKVLEIAEKKVISNHATVGCYYYKHGTEYVKYAEQMISKNIRTNNEFYIAPVYNEFIADNANIHIYPVQEMHGLGTPEDVKIFESNHERTK